MRHLSTQRRKPTATIIALPIMLLACAGLTACGSSSSSTTSTAANAAATSTPAPSATSGGASTTGTAPSGSAPAATPPTGAAPAGTKSGARPGAARFAAVRECLQKNGVTLPARPAGGGTAQRGGPGLLGGGASGSGFKLPKGMTRAQYEAVLAKCGGGLRPGGFRGRGARPAFNSPRFQQALTSFAACLRQQGIDIPAPNTSGKGPIFSTKGIDTASAKFKEAEAKCRPALVAGLRAGARSGTSASAASGTGTSG
jgi:hypothetical protein